MLSCVHKFEAVELGDDLIAHCSIVVWIAGEMLGKLVQRGADVVDMLMGD